MSRRDEQYRDYQPYAQYPGRYMIRERLFAIGDDYWVTDQEGEKTFWVDGKALRVRETFELRLPDGSVLAKIRRKLVSIHDDMKIEDAGGAVVATVRRKRLAAFRERFGVELADGTDWKAHGSILDREYEIEDADGNRVAHISRKWFRVRDTYGVDIPAGYDHAFVVAVAVAIERLAEEHEEASRQ